jgi:probable phosphoglycerate mutase
MHDLSVAEFGLSNADDTFIILFYRTLPDGFGSRRRERNGISMTRIYLIRHAEAEGNLYRIAQGQCNSLITDRGHRQIAALQKRFEDIHIDAVYSSDLYRTCVTAGALYIPKHLPLQKRAGLREICVGDWEEKTWGEIARDEPENMMNFSKHLERWSVPNAETPEQVRDRALASVLEIAAENDGRTVAAFSHGCAIRILLATLEGKSIAQVGETPHGDNTAVSLLEFENGRLHVVFRDDASHIQNSLSTFMKQTWWKRPNALEPGLCFSPLRLPEQADWFQTLAGELWKDGKDRRTMDAALLTREAATRPTLCAQLEGASVGLLQMNPDKESAQTKGWVALCGIAPDYRAKGYGVQLLGQAVLYYRRLGRQALRLALAEGNETGARFFADYGFHDTGERTADRRGVWEKDISFHPLPE